MRDYTLGGARLVEGIELGKDEPAHDDKSADRDQNGRARISRPPPHRYEPYLRCWVTSTQQTGGSTITMSW